MLSAIVDLAWLICQCVFSNGADYHAVVDVDVVVIVVVVLDKRTISQPKMRKPGWLIPSNCLRA